VSKDGGVVSFTDKLGNKAQELRAGIKRWARPMTAKTRTANGDAGLSSTGKA
jgi:hypothetical protein